MNSTQKLNRFTTCTIDETQLIGIVGGESSFVSIIGDEADGLFIGDDDAFGL